MYSAYSGLYILPPLWPCIAYPSEYKMAEQPETPKATKTKHVKAVAKTKHLSGHSKTKRPRYASIPTRTRAGQAQLTDIFHSPAASSAEDEFAGFPEQPTTGQPLSILLPHPPSQSTAPPTQALPSASLGLQLSQEFLAQLQGMLSFLQTQSPQVPVIPQHSMGQYVYNEANPSCSPNPFDVTRGRCIDDLSCGAESPFLEQVEGDEWSDYSEHEEDTSYRLFNPSDYQPLVRRVVNTLGLHTTPPAATTPAIKGARVLKSPAPVEHYLPVPDPIAKLAADEWSHPLQARRFKNLADKLYSLAPDFTTKLAVPGIDEPIANLVSRSLLPREGESQLQDATERRLDFALRKNHEATTFSMRASASASVFSRAAMMWLDDLLEDPNPDPTSIRRSLIKLRKTAAFVADATLDANQLGARAMTAQIVARRTLWLRHWQADSTARVNLSRAPYSGSLLFGDEALKAVLVDQKDARKPVLATVKQIDHRPFRRFPSFRTNQPFRGTWSGGRGRDFRSYDYRTFRGAWNRRFQGRGPWLVSQRRQKPSTTDPTPTACRCNVGHPASDGVPVTRSYNCYHRHHKISAAQNICRRHVSSQGARNVHLYHPYCAMGSSSYSPSSVGLATVPTRHCQIKPLSNPLESCAPPFVPLVDEGPTSFQGHPAQRPPQDCCHHRCQSDRLGSPLQLPVRSGSLVHNRADSQHQLVGAKGCPLSSACFSVSVPFGPCSHSNGQHVCKITFEQTGGHQVSPSAGLSLPHLRLGRTPSTISESRTSLRDLECDGRLAQQTTGFSGRMETSSNYFPSSPVSIWRLLSQPVCFQSQLFIYLFHF
ncbi:uncharacterized protein LOC133371298 [Rhineura floridana]|uniref:uncharacterized protein LOC133371298 n=1 Tax=Rhineura floridana TaxID=261503 RepID=UPI002AC80774|nr:uncharacterized protein LOC133371298 [Rhineura floridana]